MLRVPGVTCHTGRVTIKERPLNTEEAFNEHMQMMRDGMGTAIDQIMTAGLDHLIMGIALENFWGGVAAADKCRRISRSAPGSASPWVDRDGGSAEEIRRPKIAILTPHQPRGDEMVKAYFVEAGFEVVAPQGPQMPHAAPDRAGIHSRKSATRCVSSNGRRRGAVDARHGVAVRARVAAEAERWLGKPVIAVNTVSFWDALRRCGIEDRVPDTGECWKSSSTRHRWSLRPLRPGACARCR